LKRDKYNIFVISLDLRDNIGQGKKKRFPL